MNAGTLDILLQFYMSGGVRFCAANPAFKQSAVETLQLTGLMDAFGISDRGRTHVEALLDAPLPDQKWISPIPRSKEPR